MSFILFGLDALPGICMAQRSMFKTGAQLFVAGLICSAVGLVYGRTLMEWLLPFSSWVIALGLPDFAVDLRLGENKGEAALWLVTTPQDINKDRVPSLPLGGKLQAYLYIVPAMVPMAILFSTLMVWPVRAWFERMVLLSLGLPVAVSIYAITTPVVLIGHILHQFPDVPVNNHDAYEQPLLLNWLYFVEIGGRWLLPVAGLVLCIVCMHALLALNSYVGGVVSPHKQQAQGGKH